MVEGPEESNRIIELTESARNDLATIDSATAATWGSAQAEKYIDFLTGVISLIADNPGMGLPLEKHPGYFCFVARSRQSRLAHGYRIYYRELSNGIKVIKLLHTSLGFVDSLVSHDD